MANILLATRDWVTQQLANSGGGGTAPTYANAPVGSVFSLRKKSDGTWPVRPSSRIDITFLWIGPDPDPAFGGAGMVDGVDVRIVTPS